MARPFIHLTLLTHLTCLTFAGSAHAATLADPQVDAYNVRVGTQTFAGRYQFTTNTLLVETAQAIRDLGSDIIKLYLGSGLRDQYRITLPAHVTNLVTLARDEPSCRPVLDMPFRHLIAWTYPFSTSEASWANGYSGQARTNEYRELYEFTRYLLTNYNDSGKSFYLGHWEGDWLLLQNYNANTNPTPTAIQGMVDWLNNRQQAIDNAKRNTPFTNVNVLGYTEVNRVRDAMVGGQNVNQRVINKVVPCVTNLDFLSWSSYDGMGLSGPDLQATLNYMESMLPANKAGTMSGPRIWIGEYGWGHLATDAQEPLTRAYIQRLLPCRPRFILFWEIYNNEPNRNFCLVDSNNIQTACWYLHQRFINRARLAAAQFLETNRRLPNGREFAALTTPILNQFLPSPIALSINNDSVTWVSNSVARVSGTLTQGIYGDECATVWVWYGRHDGGSSERGWEQSRRVGLNTNFNPMTFTADLTDLAPATNSYLRFYATNATAAAWAPSSTQFETPSLR